MDSVPHPDHELLLRLVDRDLSAEECSGIGEHLRICQDCTGRLAALRTTLETYESFHQSVLKAAIPPPPRAWKLDLPARPRTYRPPWWLAAAAALMAVFLIVRRFEDAPSVRAAELLRKASAAEQTGQPVPQARIRIRTRLTTVDRLARVSSGDNSADSTVRALFAASGYGWEDPLSAAAFAHWRDGLPRKHDQVDENDGMFLVRTSAESGPLSDAALTLRVTDLRAVACTLRLRSGGETIVITQLPAEGLSVPVPAVQSAEAPKSATVPPEVSASPDDELRVIDALHKIHADLGEPVEVQRDGARVVVRATGLEEHRRDQFRTALSGIPMAQIRFEDAGVRAPEALVPTRPATSADKVNPLVVELGNPGLSDTFMDATDRANEHAFALRVLARRFPPDVAKQLSPSGVDTLQNILSEHAAGITTALSEIRRLLARVLPNSSPTATPAHTGGWQSQAEALPASVDQMDRLLNGASDASDARKAQLARILTSLRDQMTDFQSAVRE